MHVAVQACQGDAGYADVAAAHADELQGYDESSISYKLHLQCASALFSAANIISDVVFLFDIILNFLTGFVPKRSSKPVYRFRSIAWNYASDTFVFDAAATMPWEQVGYHVPTLLCHCGST
jgi:hypothetical protein